MKPALILLVGLLGCADALELELENKGRVTLHPKGARVTCQGVTRLLHPDFEIRSRGQLVGFFGASLELDHPGADPSTLKVSKELASIVALGEVTVVFHSGKSAHSVNCQRAVYVVKDNSWLIDGKSWPEGAGSP